MKPARLIALFAAIAVVSPMPLAAQGQTCGANAVEIGRSENNGEVTLDCQCNVGYVKSGGSCVPAGPVSKAPPFKLRSLLTTGVVSIVLPDGRRLDANAARATPLVAGTRIATGPGSSAVLVFAGQSTVKLGENTVFAIETPPGKQPFMLRLATGVIELVEQGGRKGRIRTPTYVLAVRGTAVKLRTGPAGGQVTLSSGIVDVLDRDGKLVVTLKPHQQVDISADGKIGTPRAVQ